MISKELLSEVLNEDIEHIYDKLDMGENYICYMPKVGANVDINVYELAHKCKEWAFDNGYYLTIHNDAIDIIAQTSCRMMENITDGSFKYSPFLVFKACQWILENKKIEMNMNTIYKALKYINDFRAIKNNRIGKRIGWRIGGKISNNFLNKLFK